MQKVGEKKAYELGMDIMTLSWQKETLWRALMAPNGFTVRENNMYGVETPCFSWFPCRDA